MTRRPGRFRCGKLTGTLYFDVDDDQDTATDALEVDEWLMIEAVDFYTLLNGHSVDGGKIICPNKVPMDKAQYRKHVKWLHAMGRFPCSEPGCNFVAPSELWLAGHMAEKHDQLYQCRSCHQPVKHTEKAMQDKAKMKNNVRSAMGSCLNYAIAGCTYPDCNKMGNDEVNMVTHVVDSHGIEDRKEAAKFVRKDAFIINSFKE